MEEQKCDFRSSGRAGSTLQLETPFKGTTYWERILTINLNLIRVVFYPSLTINSIFFLKKVYFILCYYFYYYGPCFARGVLPPTRPLTGKFKIKSSCSEMILIIFFLFIPQVLVEVLDKNDSPPSFRGAQLDYSVSEDLPPGQTIALVRATDPDTLGKISYRLVDGGDSKFELEPNSGVLRLNDSLDRETKNFYKLHIRADDGIQYSDAHIKITVR